MRENKTCLHIELETMSTAQLDDILQAELQKEQPDENVVLPILEILEAREGERPVEISGANLVAWDRFTENAPEAKPRRPSRKWVASVAAAVAIVCLVFLAIPQDAEADTLFDRLLHLTDSVLQFFDPDRDPGDLEKEYVFETDHPGLQRLHDKLAELGVTEPVVPMWLPEGYELTELKTVSMSSYEKVFANFSDSTKTIIMQYNLTEETTATQYETKNKQVEIYESTRVYHTIIENEESLSATWERDTVECLLVADLEKEVLYVIINSIYRRNTQ